MNIIYTVCDSDYAQYTAKMLRSLAKHVKDNYAVNLAYAGINIHDFEKIMKECEKLKWIYYIKITENQWNQNRMTAKIEALEETNICFYDNVIVADGDLIFQADPFEIFDDSDFDIFLTTRHYDYWYKANGGVWGYKCNLWSQKFIDFFIDQIKNPTWPPYVEFLKKWNHYGKKDWFVDQDFLCTVLENELPFYCKIKDAGWQYNYCPTVEEDQPETWEKAKAEIEAARGNKDIKVLHFKGKLKELM